MAATRWWIALYTIVEEIIIIIKSANSRAVGLSIQMYRSPMAVWTSFTGMAITQRYQPATRGQSAHTVRLDNPTDHLSTVSAISTTISRHSRSALRTNMGTDHYLLLSTNGLWSRGWQEGSSRLRWHLGLAIWALPNCGCVIKSTFVRHTVFSSTAQVVHWFFELNCSTAATLPKTE